MNEALVDTDILSLFFKGHAQVKTSVGCYLAVWPCLTLSVLTYYEIRRGLEDIGSSRRLQEFEAWTALNRVMPLGLPVARIAARLHAKMKRAGTPVGEVDLLLAATAVHQGLDLATHNRRHFERFPGVKVVDWTEDVYA